MAGIITSVADDIKKLQDLKKEIVDIKEKLKSINITVDIDIKENLEKQLQGLMTQYDGIAKKISQTEGQIILSVQNINKATERIVEAQQKTTQSAQNNVKMPSVSLNVEEQAKSYDELRVKIETINGTREELIRLMVEEMNEIRRLNAEIKNVNKTQDVNGTMTNAAKNKLVRLNNELLTHKTALSEVRQVLNNNAKLDNAAATSMDGLSQSLSQMRVVYRGLTEDERNSPFGQQLLASIQQADAKIKELDASIGNHQRNVGNYISAFDGFVDIKSADALKDKFREANIAIEETEKSIQNLSQVSSEYVSKGEDLKTEIDMLTVAFRQAAQQGLSADEQIQGIEHIKSKIQEYGTIMVESSAAAQAAYDLQKEKIVSLETELTNLQVALQNALNEGNTASGDVLAQQILRISAELQTAQLRLGELSSAANEAKVSLNMVVEEQARMSQGVSSNNSFIGNIIDLAKIAKEELKDFLKPATESVSNFTASVKEKMNDAGQFILNTFSNISQRIGFDTLGNAFNSVGSSISEYTSKITNAATGNGKFQQSLSSFKEGLNQLPIPLGKSIDGVVAMTKSLWAMVATPVGAVLAGIVFALQALFQWFTKDAEGQRVFAKGSAYLSSILSSLMDIVVTIGKYLYHAFADAGAPLNSFTKGLKTTFVSAVKTVSELVGGLGKTLKGIFTTDWDTFKDGVSQMGKGLRDAGKTMVSAVETAIKGVTGSVKLVGKALTDDNLAEDISKHWDNAIPKAEKSAVLAEREANARIKAQEAQEKAAKLDSEIAEKREKIYTLTGKAKDAAIEEAKALMKAKYDDQIEVQKEQLDILKTKNNLHTSSLEDLAKERDLNIQLLRTQAQREASTRMMTRMQQSNLNKMKTLAKGATSKSNAFIAADTKWEEIVRKNANERVKVEMDIEDQITEARIKAMEDGAEKIRAERDRQNEKELEQIKKQRDAAIEAERNRQKAEFDAEQAVIKAQGGKTEKWDESKIDEEFINKIKKQYEEIYKETQKSQKNSLLKSEMSAMRDYLKEYGSFQQQKLAITEEYEQKIREAQTEGERLRLQKEKRKAIAETDISNLANSIDWGALVSGVGNLVKDMIPPMMKQLEAYTQTQQYRDADMADKEKINSLLNEMRSFFGGQDLEKLSDNLGAAISQFQLASIHLQGLREREAELIGQLEDAELSYKDGTMSAEEYDKIREAVDNAGREVAAAQDELKEFGIRVNAASDALSNYTSTATSKMLNDTGFNAIEGSSDFVNISGKLDKYLAETKKVEREVLLKKAEDQKISFVDDMGNDITGAMTDVLEEVVGGGMSRAMTGITTAIGDGMSGIMGTVAEFAGSALGIFLQLPKMILQVADMIKNFVTGILDSFSQLLSFSWLEDLVNSILDAVSNLINTIFDLPENLWHVLSSIVVNGVGGLVNTVLGRVGNILTFGALSSGGPAEWFTNSNAKEVAETIDRLTNRNELLTVAIEELTDEMENARGAKAIDISRRAIELQEETNKNYALIANAQAGYHGDHHSWNYYWGGYSQEQINRLSQQMGREWNGDIWSLSPEEMKMLQGNVDMWEQILTTGKGGYGYSVGEKLQAYIDQAGKLEDITNQLYETLTTTTADNVFDDFLNSLYALADGSDEVFDNIADSWQQMVNKMAVNNIVGASFQEKLNDWYQRLATLNESRTEGKITDEEYKAKLDILQKEYEDYVKKAQNDIESLRDVGVIQAVDSEADAQKATSRGFGSEMTHEDAGELSGRFTAMYESNIRIEAATQQQTLAITELSGNMSNMIGQMQNMYNIADETRTILVNSFLELQQISENTGAIVKPIKQIQTDIAEVKRNTSRL